VRCCRQREPTRSQLPHHSLWSICFPVISFRLIFLCSCDTTGNYWDWFFCFCFLAFTGTLAFCFVLLYAFSSLSSDWLATLRWSKRFRSGSRRNKQLGTPRGMGMVGSFFFGRISKRTVVGGCSPLFSPLDVHHRQENHKKTRHWPHSFSFLSFLQPWIVFFLCLFVCFHFFSSSDILSQSLQLELFMGGVQVTISLLFFSRSGWRFVSLLDFSSVLRAGKLDDAAQDEQHTRLSD